MRGDLLPPLRARQGDHAQRQDEGAQPRQHRPQAGHERTAENREIARRRITDPCGPVAPECPPQERRDAGEQQQRPGFGESHATSAARAAGTRIEASAVSRTKPTAFSSAVEGSPSPGRWRANFTRSQERGRRRAPPRSPPRSRAPRLRAALLLSSAARRAGRTASRDSAQDPRDADIEEVDLLRRVEPPASRRPSAASASACAAAMGTAAAPPRRRKRHIRSRRREERRGRGGRQNRPPRNRRGRRGGSGTGPRMSLGSVKSASGGRTEVTSSGSGPIRTKSVAAARFGSGAAVRHSLR